MLDLQLPDLSGLDLQKRMAEAGLEIPIVFLTGHLPPLPQTPLAALTRLPAYLDEIRAAAPGNLTPKRSATTSGASRNCYQASSGSNTANGTAPCRSSADVIGA